MFDVVSWFIREADEGPALMEARTTLGAAHDAVE